MALPLSPKFAVQIAAQIQDNFDLILAMGWGKSIPLVKLIEFH